MSKRRKLAAILFADIEGYSALMQADEVFASQILRRFQRQLEAQVSRRKGRVVNFYGDGALCIFEIPIDAVRCATALQQEFRNEPSVPVRMGIHTGTVTFDADKVFGDAVNIASRLESMSPAGGVLVSKRVRDEIKNNPDIQLEQLGRFTFKNIQEPILLFAIANDGLSVALKDGSILADKEHRSIRRLIPYLLGMLILVILALGWKYDLVSTLRTTGNHTSQPLAELAQVDTDKRVAVLVFENQTMSPELDVFGKMVSDWVTKGLMELEDVKVISAANIQQQVVTAGIGDLQNSADVGLAIQGRYYMQEDQVIIHANVVDVAKGDVIHALDPVQGPKSEMTHLLQEMTEEILGYWSVREQNRFQRNPPKYKAYQNLLAAEHIFGEAEHAEKIESLLTQAYQMDTTFYAPLLKLLVHYSNPGGSAALRDSLIQFIDQKDPPFTRWEKLRYDGIKAGAAGERDWIKAAKINEQLYAMDPSDGNANYNASHFYLRANQPAHAIALLEQFDPRFRDFEVDYSWREMRRVEGHYLLGQYGDVISVAENYPFPKMLTGIAELHLQSLIRLDSMDAVEKAYRQYAKQGVFDFGGNPQHAAAMLEAICLELSLMDKHDELAEYAEDLRDLAEKDLRDQDYFYYKGLALYYVSDFSGALDLWQQEKRNPTRSLRYLGNLSRIGMMHAKLGDTVAAQKALLKLSNSTSNFFFAGLEFYAKSRINLALGHTDVALTNLQSALEGSMVFYPIGLWANDVFLKELFDHPTFREMVRPKG